MPVVLDVWSHVEPRFGGVGPAASALATAVERRGITMNQVAICDESEIRLADGIDPRVIRLCGSGPRGLSDARLAKELRRAIEESDVCHVHGMWLPHCLAVRRMASERGKPVVSSVHGMLEQWEMRHKWLKKSLYSLLFERPSLRRSTCLRALSEHEVGDYRRFGSRAAIAVVPNGIDALERVDPALFFEKFPALRHKEIVLFLGRVHHKKGVFNLLRAWKTVAARREDAHLVIAGPEYGNTGDEARRLITELELARTVTMAGVISGRMKLAALSAAKYFSLPSYSEGLSVAVLEALSIGLPPVITPECNIPSVGASGAGRITSNEPAELADTLISCLEASAREWQEMSCAGRRLARSEFDWNGIAETMRSVYEWLLGGNRPACVEA
jgi:glycosyltransferase involved in cell wall biosynthesis